MIKSAITWLPIRYFNETRDATGIKSGFSPPFHCCNDRTGRSQRLDFRKTEGRATSKSNDNGVATSAFNALTVSLAVVLEGRCRYAWKVSWYSLGEPVPTEETVMGLKGSCRMASEWIFKPARCGGMRGNSLVSRVSLSTLSCTRITILSPLR